MTTEGVSVDSKANEDRKAYQRALLRAKAVVGVKIAFYIHLAVYLVVNVFLVSINLMTSPSYLWCLWPIMGWGTGIIFHGVIALLFRSASELKENMIEGEMQRELNKAVRSR